MKNFLDSRRGARILAIIELAQNRQPTHYYQGVVTAVGDGFIILRDEQLGDMAISMEKIVSVKILTDATPGLDVSGATIEGFER